ncbi:MAG: hypothetical protein ACK4UX_13225, partial [Thiobacillus sp.]
MLRHLRHQPPCGPRRISRICSLRRLRRLRRLRLCVRQRHCHKRLVVMVVARWLRGAGTDSARGGSGRLCGGGRRQCHHRPRRQLRLPCALLDPAQSLLRARQHACLVSLLRALPVQAHGQRLCLVRAPHSLLQPPPALRLRL